MNQRTKKVLFLGDVVDFAGKTAISKYLPVVVEKYKPDLIVVNGENMGEGGRGIDDASAAFLFKYNVDVITLGNHTYDILKQKCLEDPRIIRPANITKHLPGKGYTVITKDGVKYGIINVMGNKEMNMIVDNVFLTIERVLKEIEKCNFILIDVHAQSHIEKQCIGHYFNGKVTAIVGTHTHVPTSDCQVLSKGTAYQTDAGMCGCYTGIRGKHTYKMISKLVYWDTHYDKAYSYINDDEVTICGSIIYFDPISSKATSIKPIIYGHYLYGSIR